MIFKKEKNIKPIINYLDEQIDYGKIRLGIAYYEKQFNKNLIVIFVK